MPETNINHNKETSDSNKSYNDKRKRVNRIKAAIVILVIILLILPSIFCIILSLRVSRLQEQVNNLLTLHSQYGLQYDSMDSEAYAYAAERNKDIILDSIGHTLPGDKEVSDTDDSNLDSEMDLTVKDENSGLLVNESELIEMPDATVEEKKENTTSEQTEQKGKYSDKRVYLTFDDGPSMYTDDILDILAEYKVKATFFVVGKTDSQSKKLYQRIIDEGHTLGMHSYSHQYSKIYNSLEDFDKDFTKLWKLLYDTTGYKPSIFRFPGGSDNKVNKNGMEDFIRYLNEADIVYFDWNVLNGDATGVTYTKEQLIKNVIDGVAVKENSIVLLHDSETKQATVDSLPDLLEKLISEDAQILPLDNQVPPIQMIKADTIK